MLDRYKEVLASFASHDVRYVVIGGVAAILHGVPRITVDVDILIEATEDNARRLLAALEEVGLGTACLTTPEEINANAVTIFQDRLRVDVQTATPGISFAEAWKAKQVMEIEGQPFYVLSKRDVIASKLAAGRDIDLEDVRLLRLDDEPSSGP